MIEDIRDELREARAVLPLGWRWARLGLLVVSLCTLVMLIATSGGAHLMFAMLQLLIILTVVVEVDRPYRSASWQAAYRRARWATYLTILFVAVLAAIEFGVIPSLH